MALDVLQSKNAVAHVILLSYHSLPLVKVNVIYVSLSCSLFSELSELFLSPTFPFFSSFFLSHHGSPFALFICPTSEFLSYYHDCELKLCKTLAFFFVLSSSFWKLPPLLLVNSSRFIVTTNHSPSCLLFCSFLTLCRLAWLIPPAF